MADSALNPGTPALVGEAVVNPPGDFLGIRDELERKILPLATSVDGRQFTFQASMQDLRLQVGGYVVLERDGDRRIGQVLTLRPDSASAADLGLDPTATARIRLARGEGVILSGDLRPFHDASARTAEPDEVAAWLEGIRPNRSTLTIGDLLLAPGVPATLDAGGFNRHTFMCASPGRARRILWGWCWSGCWLRPASASSSWIPIPTMFGWRRPVRASKTQRRSL